MGKAVVRLIIEREERRSGELFIPMESIVWRDSLGPGAEVDSLVARACDLMERRLRHPTSLSQLAMELGLSRRSLELRFRKAGRRSPAKEWMALRLAEAMRLMRETDWRLYEIAERTGFESQQRFAQAFRENMGQSASAWRHENTR